MEPSHVGNSLVSFQPRGDGNGLHVRDELGDNEFVVGTDADVSLEQASPDRFVVPVDAAVSFTAAEIHLPSSESVLVRDGTGEHRAELLDTPESFPRGDYFLEISGTTKSYLALQDVSFTGQHVEDGDQRLPRVRFDEPTAVTLGTRSLHDRPRATITVSDDPRDLATAISYLGSSIKEWSCERSWPTIRGHPPAIERGDELHVPDVLEKPDTGVTIAVPPTYADVYRIAPLAFYLGADVVPGEEAELRLDVGHTEPLRRPGRTLEESVDRLLARCLLLDSLVRVGGYYSFPRYEYDEVAPHLPFYPPELYDRSVEEQLVEYLEVPFDVLEPHVPKWTTTAVLRPRLEDAAVVPPLLDSLSRVHVATGVDASAEPGPTLDTTVTAYAGRTPPVGETRLVPAAFENLRGREQSVPAECRFDFFGVGQAAVDAYDRVCNAVDTGHGDGVPTRRRRTRPTREVLRRALGTSEFLHFGGDVTDEGVVCADGALPWTDLGSVEATVVSIAGGAGGDEVDAAVSLVESGASAAVVFDGAVPDETVGQLAGYLRSAFSLAWAAELAADDTPHRLVGDATRSVTSRSGGTTPEVLDFTSVGTDRHRLTYRTEVTEQLELGSVLRPAADFAEGGYYLTGGSVVQSLGLTSAEVVDLFEEGYVVRLNGTVYPSVGELTLETVCRSARRALDETGQRM